MHNNPTVTVEHLGELLRAANQHTYDLARLYAMSCVADVQPEDLHAVATQARQILAELHRVLDPEVSDG